MVNFGVKANQLKNVSSVFILNFRMYRMLDQGFELFNHCLLLRNMEGFRSKLPLFEFKLLLKALFLRSGKGDFSFVESPGPFSLLNFSVNNDDGYNYEYYTAK